MTIISVDTVKEVYYIVVFFIIIGILFLLSIKNFIKYIHSKDKNRISYIPIFFVIIGAYFLLFFNCLIIFLEYYLNASDNGMLAKIEKYRDYFIIANLLIVLIIPVCIFMHGLLDKNTKIYKKLLITFLLSMFVGLNFFVYHLSKNSDLNLSINIIRVQGDFLKSSDMRKDIWVNTITENQEDFEFKNTFSFWIALVPLNIIGFFIFLTFSSLGLPFKFFKLFKKYFFYNKELDAEFLTYGKLALIDFNKKLILKTQKYKEKEKNLLYGYVNKKKEKKYKNKMNKEITAIKNLFSTYEEFYYMYENLLNNKKIFIIKKNLILIYGIICFLLCVSIIVEMISSLFGIYIFNEFSKFLKNKIPIFSHFWILIIILYLTESSKYGYGLFSILLGNFMNNKMLKRKRTRIRTFLLSLYFSIYCVNGLIVYLYYFYKELFINTIVDDINFYFQLKNFKFLMYMFEKKIFQYYYLFLFLVSLVYLVFSKSSYKLFEQMVLIKKSMVKNE